VGSAKWEKSAKWRPEVILRWTKTAQRERQEIKRPKNKSERGVKAEK
jgi:hypothetical protein